MTPQSPRSPTGSTHSMSRFRPWHGRQKLPEYGLKSDLFCAFGEFIGTAMFLFLGLGGSNFARLSPCLLLLIDSLFWPKRFELLLPCAFSGSAWGMPSDEKGLSLLCVGMLFVKISGSVFNPAIALSAFLVGNIRLRRMSTQLYICIAEHSIRIYRTICWSDRWGLLTCRRNPYPYLRQYSSCNSLRVFNFTLILPKSF
jgi:Major intrinsic protein